MNISDTAHSKAIEVEAGALKQKRCSTEHPATYWLALACALLTSSVKAERETGKALVREWRKNGNSAI